MKELSHMKTKSAKTKNPDGITVYPVRNGWRWRHYRKGRIVHASTEAYRDRKKCILNLIAATRMPISYEFVMDHATAAQLKLINSQALHAKRVTVVQRAKEGRK